MSLPPRFSKLAEKSKPTFKTYSCKAGRIISGRLFNPFSIEDGHGGFLQWGHPQNQRFQYKNGLNFGWFGDPPQEKKAPWIFGCHSWRCRYLSPGQVSNPGIEVGRWGPVRRHSRSLFLIFHGATSPLLWHGKKTKHHEDSRQHSRRNEPISGRCEEPQRARRVESEGATHPMPSIWFVYLSTHTGNTPRTETRHGGQQVKASFFGMSKKVLHHVTSIAFRDCSTSVEWSKYLDRRQARSPRKDALMFFLSGTWHVNTAASCVFHDRFAHLEVSEKRAPHHPVTRPFLLLNIVLKPMVTRE